MAATENSKILMMTKKQQYTLSCSCCNICGKKLISEIHFLAFARPYNLPDRQSVIQEPINPRCSKRKHWMTYGGVDIIGTGDSVVATCKSNCVIPMKK